MQLIDVCIVAFSTGDRNLRLIDNRLRAFGRQVNAAVKGIRSGVLERQDRRRISQIQVVSISAGGVVCESSNGVGSRKGNAFISVNSSAIRARRIAGECNALVKRCRLTRADSAPASLTGIVFKCCELVGCNDSFNIDRAAAVARRIAGKIRFSIQNQLKI